MISVDAVQEEARPQDTGQLQDNHVVGEDVRVTRHHCCGCRGLIPPSLVAHIENKDEEREKDEDEADQAGCIDGNAPSGVEAVIKLSMEGGVGGGID